MKKWIALILIVLVLIVPVSAAPAEVDTQSLDDSLQGEETVFGTPGEILSAVLENRLDLNGQTVLDRLFSLFFASFKKSLPFLMGLFAIGILLSVAKNMELLHGRMEDAALLGGRLAFAVLLLSASLSLVSGAREAVTTATGFAETATPVLVTLLVSCGATGTATLISPSVTLLSSSLISLVEHVLFPLLLAALLLTVLDFALPESRLKGLADLMKSSASWLLGGSFSVFAGILSVQGLTGGVRDGASLRSVRYAINTSVPVIGSAVSESLSAVFASAITVKGALGVTGIVVIAGILLVPVLNLIAFLLSLRLLAACMTPFAGSEVLRPIREACACLRLIVAALVGVGLLWFLFLGILIGAGGAL